MVTEIDIFKDPLEILKWFKICLLISILFFHFINFKLKIYQAAVLYTILSTIIFGFYTASLSGDMPFYCKVANYDYERLNEILGSWTQRNFLFWQFISVYGSKFGGCIKGLMFYMAPLFYILFYYLIKFSKRIFNQDDNYLNILVIPFVVIILSFIRFEFRSFATYPFCISFIYFFRERKLFKALVSAVAGFFIHNSIILFLPTLSIFAISKKVNLFNISLLTMINLLISLFVKNWYSRGLLSTTADTYATSLLFYFSFTFVFLFVFIYKYFSKRSYNIDNQIEYQKYSLFVFISVIIFGLCGFEPSTLTRIFTYYLFLYLPIIVGFLNLKFRYIRYRLLFSSLTLIPFLSYFKI